MKKTRRSSEAMGQRPEGLPLASECDIAVVDLRTTRRERTGRTARECSSDGRHSAVDIRRSIEFFPRSILAFVGRGPERHGR